MPRLTRLLTLTVFLVLTVFLLTSVSADASDNNNNNKQGPGPGRVELDQASKMELYRRQIEKQKLRRRDNAGAEGAEDPAAADDYASLDLPLNFNNPNIPPGVKRALEEIKRRQEEQKALRESNRKEPPVRRNMPQQQPLMRRSAPNVQRK